MSLGQQFYVQQFQASLQQQRQPQSTQFEQLTALQNGQSLLNFNSQQAQSQTQQLYQKVFNENAGIPSVHSTHQQSYNIAQQQHQQTVQQLLQQQMAQQQRAQQKQQGTTQESAMQLHQRKAHKHAETRVKTPPVNLGFLFMFLKKYFLD